MEHQQQQPQQHTQQPSAHQGMRTPLPPSLPAPSLTLAAEQPGEQKHEDSEYAKQGKEFASGYAKEMGKETAKDQYDELKDKMNEVPEDVRRAAVSSVLREIAHARAEHPPQNLPVLLRLERDRAAARPAGRMIFPRCVSWGLLAWSTVVAGVYIALESKAMCSRLIDSRRVQLTAWTDP